MSQEVCDHLDVWFRMHIVHDSVCVFRHVHMECLDILVSGVKVHLW